MNFELLAGEVHVLVGENGAGKSTLVKLLSGIYQPDQGQILMDGQPIHLRDPHTAQAHGVSTVHQELNLVPHLDVGKNIYLGREPMRPGGRRRRVAPGQRADLCLLRGSIDDALAGEGNPVVATLVGGDVVALDDAGRLN